MDNSIRIILTSTSSEAEAKMLASGIVEAKLAACVQISAPGTSIYRWEDAIQCEREYYIAIKTNEGACDAAIDWLRKNHPYDTPEIISLEGSASRDYLEWMRATTL
jgi:periplasmic divalent cation tolerance protein